MAEELIEATERTSWRIYASFYVLEELERVLTNKLGFSRRMAQLWRRPRPTQIRTCPCHGVSILTADVAVPTIVTPLLAIASTWTVQFANPLVPRDGHVKLINHVKL